MQRLIRMDTHELSTTQRLAFSTPRTSRLRPSSSIRVSPNPPASPVERQSENNSGVKAREFRPCRKASKVGAKKKHSSSGCAVTSKTLREERNVECEDSLNRTMTKAMRSTRTVNVNITYAQPRRPSHNLCKIHYYIIATGDSESS